MHHRTWRRKNYFIRKDFQGRFVLRFFITIFIGAIVFTAILSFFSAHTLTMTYEDSYLRLDRTPKALFLEIVRAYGVYILLLGIAISVASLFLSHRIAGPLFRLEKSVEEITRGNLSFHITLRRKDEVKELADLMNEMIKTVSDRLRDIGRHADLVQAELSVLSAKLADEKEGEIAKRVSEAERSIEDLKQSLSFFRLKD